MLRKDDKTQMAEYDGTCRLFDGHISPTTTVPALERGNLGADEAYFERVYQVASGNNLEGCAQYDNGHNRNAYRLEVYCCL